MQITAHFRPPFWLKSILRRSIGSWSVVAMLMLLPLCTASPAWPAYRIILKSGAAFITQSYWRHNGQIRFYSRGGIVGLPRLAIARIEDIDADLRPSTSSSPKIETTRSVPTTKAITPPARLAPNTPGDAVDAALKKELAALKGRFNRYHQMSNAELYQLAKDLTAFRDKILGLRKGHLLTDELQAVYAMGDEIEKLLKSRGQ